MSVENRDDRAKITLRAGIQNVLPCTDPLHDPAHLRHSRAMSRFPSSWPPPIDEVTRNTLPVHKVIRPKPGLRFTTEIADAMPSPSMLQRRRRCPRLTRRGNRAGPRADLRLSRCIGACRTTVGSLPVPKGQTLRTVDSVHLNLFSCRLQ